MQQSVECAVFRLLFDYRVSFSAESLPLWDGFGLCVTSGDHIDHDFRTAVCLCWLRNLFQETPLVMS
jgi:hypothetical protein